LYLFEQIVYDSYKVADGAGLAFPQVVDAINVGMDPGESVEAH
jgi:hypothetical protein